MLIATGTFEQVAMADPGTAAADAAFAPPDRPGPDLEVPETTLRGALECWGDFRGSSLQPVLLSPATGVTPEENYSWNYERAFRAEGRPYCTVTMPHHTLGDIQTAAEYLVHGIRTEQAMAGRRIAVLGHSQGGMSMRWALRFWPDTRALVDDVIGMAGSNHGTTLPFPCLRNGTTCPPAVWQQTDRAQFIDALNSYAETWEGISYTEIYTRTDAVVQPSLNDDTASSALRTGDGMITNVAIQSICPADVEEHLAVGTFDATAYALVDDALDRPGPADPSQIDRAVCARPYQPGVNPANANTYLQTLSAAPGLAGVITPGVNLVGAPEVRREPPLRCYTRPAGCSDDQTTSSPELDGRPASALPR